MADTSRLRPAFAAIIDGLMDILREADARFVITSAYRSSTEQGELYSKWLREREDPEAARSVFTPLPPGRSQHERGFAVDIARVGVPAETDVMLRELGAWWRSVGGVWGGDRDPVHFEAPKSWTGRG